VEPPVTTPAEASSKQNALVETCQLADPNILLASYGKMIFGSQAHDVVGAPCRCPSCGAVPTACAREVSTGEPKSLDNLLVKVEVNGEKWRIPISSVMSDDFDGLLGHLNHAGVPASVTLGFDSGNSQICPWTRVWHATWVSTMLSSATVGGSQMLRLVAMTDPNHKPLSITLCSFCGAELEAAADAMAPAAVDATYVLSKPATETSADEDTHGGIAPPMVIFCIDISASMSTTLKLEGGGYATRLQCVQTAVAQQLLVLQQQHPGSIAVVITFGAEVCVYTDSGNRSMVARRAHEVEADLLAKGESLSASCTEVVGSAIERLRATISSLRPCGNTALGPALAVGVGLAKGRAGSKIVLCTDGMANNGVGAIRNREVCPFYGEIGRRAAEEGTCISVVTMEGEECSMENLGISADLTGGQVEMVEMQSLSSKVGSMLADPILGSGLEVTIIAGGGATISTDLTVAAKGGACVATHMVGNVTGKTTATFGLVGPQGLVGAQAGSRNVVPVQMQLLYTRPNGEQVMQVLTSCQPCTADREVAEADINSTCVALGGIHVAARLAQVGKYQEARAQLISTSRLLQRAMHNVSHQEAYLAFIGQAEKLDGFMRERESQEKVFGIDTSAQRGRDDDASRAMYQMKSLSKQEFQSRA